VSVDCRELLGKIHAYLDGELDATNCDEVRAHIEACGPCMSNAEFETAFKAFVARSCCDEPPAGFFDRVRAALDRES
jgi:mycothiol system anti-sigma-R factor